MFKCLAMNQRVVRYWKLFIYKMYVYFIEKESIKINDEYLVHFIFNTQLTYTMNVDIIINNKKNNF